MWVRPFSSGDDHERCQGTGILCNGLSYNQDAGELVQFPASLFRIQLPGHLPGKAVNHVSSIWNLAMLVGDSDRIPWL